MVHIQSSGGVYNGQDFASQYIQNIFAFIGVTDHTKINVEGIDHQPHPEASILEASLANAKKCCKRILNIIPFNIMSKTSKSTSLMPSALKRCFFDVSNILGFFARLSLQKFKKGC